MKKNSLNLFLFLIGLSLLYGCGDLHETNPSFILFLVDDLGSQDVGCYGQQIIQTPNIDALAEEGMLWKNAYSSCPVCSPTRAAILTGKSPARLRFTGHVTHAKRHLYPDQSRIIPPDDLLNIPHEEITLPEALKPAGYTSICIGKWHIGGEGYHPLDQGFDASVGFCSHGRAPTHFYPYKSTNPNRPLEVTGLDDGEEGEYLADRLTDEAIDFIEDNRGNPYFMYLSHYAVHTPLEAPDSLVRKYEPLVQGTGIDAVYAAMVHNLDWNLGRLLEAVKASGQEGNTVIIFASDNGAIHSTSDNSPFRMGKGYLYEGGVRVPFIIKWKDRIKPGTVCTGRTISPDIYTTIMEMAGGNVQPGENLDGRSLVRDFTGKTKDDPGLYWYYPHYNLQARLPGASVISSGYKLIEFYDPERTELYDLEKDIGETSDLSGSMPEKTAEMLSNLHAWLKDADPVRHTLRDDETE